ncbi:MAG: hypothetical protein ACR2IK_21940 [Chloroflexota bacterium]
MPERHVQRIHTTPVVLDIGEGMGGLIFYTPAALLGVEIEVAPAAYPDFKTHTEVDERVVNGQTLYAGVFPPIRVGDYRVCRPADRAGQSFSIAPGQVTELDWRDSA